MKQQTLGKMIAARRKELGMTQLELAEKMGVTDKAVSKWERDLSCPDVNTLPRLAEIFEISVDELMQSKTAAPAKKDDQLPLVQLILRSVALAMGIAVFVLSLLQELEINSALSMLGLGLACLAVSALPRKAEK